MQDNRDEIFPIVDTKGEVIGSASRGECHNGSMLLHPVVHLHIFNSKSEIYLQRRPAWKDIQPNRWDTAVGGHIDFGESAIEALHREAFEELGVSDFTPHHLLSYDFCSEVEHEFVHVYYTHYDGVITPSAELDGGRFWSIDEIYENINNELFTPNFVSEFLTHLYPAKLESLQQI